MTTSSAAPITTDSPAPSDADTGPGLSRRRFLSGAAIAGGGLVAAGLAACTTAAAPVWTFAPAPAATLAAPGPSNAAPTASPAMNHGSMSPSPSAVAPASPVASPTIVAAAPAGWSEHDVQARAVVDRFLAGEWQQVPNYGNQPLEPTIDGDTTVFQLTIDEIDHQIDAAKKPVKALGYNGTWPGPVLRVIEGDRVRAVVRNNLPETTSVHFHGQALPNAMDGVAMLTQDPIVPGGTFNYEFVAKPAGSHMYHSHHNATDQVGRGLLGAFIVDPADPAERYDRKYGVSQDIVWISNDTLGGFTINGRGFPATAPIVAKLGEKIAIRFMNEGFMMHPWHVHGVHFRVVARDGWPLGAAEFRCDTLGVNPGERFDVIIDCDNPGAWAFHCHVLPHAESMQGMFGMVTALIVEA